MSEAQKKKLIKVSTVPTSLNTFCYGQLKMLSEHYEVVAVSSPMKELDEIHKREGVRCIGIPMERHISLIKDFKSLVAMTKLFHKEKPDIVHSITPKAGLISMVAAWLNHVPVRMHTYTGLVFPTAHGIKKAVLVAMDKLLCHCATYINPEGFGVKNDLSAITSKPMHIIGHGNVRGIDLDYWKRDVSCNVSKELQEKIEGSFVFLFVGRLVKDKGINELVEAFKRLQSENIKKIKLLLVGRFEENLDPLKPETKKEIDNNPDIITVGAVEDVRPFYSVSDIFVFPSYREGFPNTPIEAGAMGLPCIVTDINGSREIIEDGNNGIIVPSKDSSALCKAMTNLLENKYLCNSLAEKARPMIVSRFEQGFVRKCLYDFYNEIM